MFITPGDIYLPNLYTNAEYKNEVQSTPAATSRTIYSSPESLKLKSLKSRRGASLHHHERLERKT